MVMEASPSPQSVGREFVRQYYTLLNKAPAHLHRFYNNFSSFVHGGLDAPNRETLPVVGQKLIHNRIQQLNFRDCHAKISQVDSQATLGSGVVVQVTGELSNGGAPMRRFTQTFVLAAQSPKKYYVHNDIFRYQDVVFSDEEGSGSARSDGEDDEPRERAAFPPPPPAPPACPAPVVCVIAEPPPPPPPPAVCVAEPKLNGHPPSDVLPALPALQASSVPAAASPERAEPPPEPELPPQPEREPTPPPQQQPQVAAAPPAAPEPKTYANLLKSGFGHAAAPKPQPQQFQPVGAQVAAPLEPRPRPPRVRTEPAAPLPLPVELPPAACAGLSPAGAAAAAAPGPAPAPTPRRYSDAQQLFLGNLPHAATEDALRTYFARFGPVAELRVHSKPAAPGAPRHPNYGFITFHTPQAALECLNNIPLYFPAEGGDGAVKLNVEEKKARAREQPRRRPPSQGRPPFPRATYRR